jgi:hypothetical protein
MARHPAPICGPRCLSRPRHSHHEPSLCPVLPRHTHIPQFIRSSGTALRFRPPPARLPPPPSLLLHPSSMCRGTTHLLPSSECQGTVRRLPSSVCWGASLLARIRSLSVASSHPRAGQCHPMPCLHRHRVAPCPPSLASRGHRTASATEGISTRGTCPRWLREGSRRYDPLPHSNPCPLLLPKFWILTS